MRQNKEIWVGVILTALLGFLLLFVHGRSVRGSENSRFHLYAQFSNALLLLLTSPFRFLSILPSVLKPTGCWAVNTLRFYRAVMRIC